jgi:hypothetical protein
VVSVGLLWRQNHFFETSPCRLVRGGILSLVLEVLEVDGEDELAVELLEGDTFMMESFVSLMVLISMK